MGLLIQTHLLVARDNYPVLLTLSRLSLWLALVQSGLGAFPTLLHDPSVVRVVSVQPAHLALLVLQVMGIVFTVKDHD